MIWTDDKVNELKSWWERKYSASYIAAEMDVSRSAVLGKINRLGLSNRGRGTRRAPQEGGRTRIELFPFLARVKHVREIEVPKDIPLPIDKSQHAVTFEKLDSMHCRWLLGEPSDQLYCGDDQKRGSSYCYRHHAIAYTKPRDPAEPRVAFDFRKRAA